MAKVFDGKKPFSSNQVISLRDFIRVLRNNINQEELMFLYHEITSEVSVRTSTIFEMIPGNSQKSLCSLLLLLFL